MPEDNKTLYFLQLPHDFFGSRRIKKLRKMENGDSLVLLYLKIQLSTLKTGGVISLSGLEENPAEEIALEISEEPEEVRRVLDFMLTFGLAEMRDDGDIFLPFVEIMTTSHTKDAERMRKARKRKKEQEFETARTQSERYVNAERTIDEQTFDRIKSKEYRVESKEQKSKEMPINQHSATIPTFPEVVAFAADRKSIVDPKRFFDWYENTGWKDSSGKPIQNWRNTFLSWERIDKKEQAETDNGTDNIFLKILEEERGQK